jgi:hypothetical protein
MMGVVLKLLVLGFVAGLRIRDDDSRGLGESTGVDMVKPCCTHCLRSGPAAPI